MQNRHHLLIVDDEPEIGAFIRDIALEVGFDAQSIDKAVDFERYYNSDTHVVVLDLFMPERDGIELLRVMADLNATSAIILISGYDKSVLSSAKKLAREQGLFVAGTLSKPFRYEEIQLLLSNLAFLSLDHRRKSGLLDPGIVTEENLRIAIETNQLEVHFQPQVELSSHRLTGVEALVRWRHPDYGLIMPNHFIPLVEQAGIMDSLTLDVLKKSLQQTSEWLQQGLRLNVAINMPPVSFKNLDLPEAISDVITAYGLDAEQVTLEVTETTLMQELIRSLDILTRIRMKGLSLSIDDFGTGYSSMVQLYRIPFSEMKIDLSFVKKATTEPEALAIVKMITMLGHELGMTVVAEGVEDEATWDLLLELGCDIAQGYYIAMPMEGAHILAWSKSEKKLKN